MARRLGSPSTMRMVNRTIVLATIRQNAPVSRAEIARLTSISAPTVSSIVADLLASGLVTESSAAASEGGRPPRLLTLSESALYVGCDLSTSHVGRLGLVNLTDEVVDVQTLAYDEALPRPEQIVEIIAGYVEAEARQRGHNIHAIGIGAPGVTDVGLGRVRWAPTLGWRDVDLAELLTTRLQLPVVVDNDINLALIGEVHQGAARDAQNAAFVSFRDGVGGAILIDGRLYRGRGAAGEVGYLVTGAPDGGDFSPFGFTEHRIFELLAEECHSQGLDTERYPLQTQALASMLLTDEGHLVFSSDTRRQVTDAVAAALASIAALLDPETIVLSGWIEDLGKEFLDELTSALEVLVASVPALRFSELGPVAVIVGAATAASRAATEAAEVVAPA